MKTFSHISIAVLLVFSMGELHAKKYKTTTPLPQRLYSESPYTPTSVKGVRVWETSGSPPTYEKRSVSSATEEGSVNGVAYTVVMGTESGSKAEIGNWEIWCSVDRMTDVTACEIKHVVLSSGQLGSKYNLKDVSHFYIRLTNDGKVLVGGGRNYHLRIDNQKAEFIPYNWDQEAHFNLIERLWHGEQLYARYQGGYTCSRFGCNNPSREEEFKLKDLSEALNLASWMVARTK